MTDKELIDQVYKAICAAKGQETDMAMDIIALVKRHHTIPTREAITKYMTERTRNMREAQERYHAQPQRHTLKAEASMHIEAFMAIYMLAYDLYTSQEVYEINKEAEERAKE